MLYYRYRPFSEFSLKELMYNELFFASAEECNDPHECRDLLQFPPDYEKWLRVLELAWKDVGENEKKPFYKKFCDYLIQKSPITVCEVLSNDFFKPLRDQDSFRTYRLELKLAIFLKNYLGGKKYFISFSKSPDNYLMWSHYANQHNGYCLIFTSLDGGLYQSKDSIKESIKVCEKDVIGNRSKPKIHLTEHVGNKFEFYDVVYGDSSESVDPFCYFPEYVNQIHLTDESERLDFFNKLEHHYLEKGACWEYEQESRLLLSGPSSWIVGNGVEYTKHQRLFHYDTSQLVGIIFGSRLCANDRNRIREIIDEKQKSFFAYFQSSLSSKERKLVLDPIEIRFASSGVSRNDPSFNKLYRLWIKEHGLDNGNVYLPKIIGDLGSERYDC